MKLTPQQEKLIDYVVHGGRNCMGIARAGTGKTSTAMQAANAYHEAYPEREILGMAFNRSISLDLQEAIPFATCKTANSFGAGAWYKRAGKTRLNKWKNKDIIKEIGSEEKFPDFARAISICKAWGIVPKGTPAEPTIHMEDTPENFSALFDNYNIDFGDCQDPVGILREALSRSILRGWKGEIDFDDQLYLPTIYRAIFPKADLLIVDEFQDMNPIQRYMARLMLKSDGRLFGLGDDCQAIYGFRGADRDSIPNGIAEFDCEVLPLTVSFRCPKAVVLRAQAFVPDIETFEGAIEGQVTFMGPKKYSLAIELKNIPGRLAILCRNNAPLISAALKLIREDVGAIILGRDLEKGLCSLIDKQHSSSLQDLNSKLYNHINKQADLYMQRKATAQADLILDKGLCLEILISNEMAVSGDVTSLKRRIRTLFSDKIGQAPVLLSTIHKAKGLEWPNVVILEESLMPSKYAKTEVELQQESNLHYVAITRAQKNLIYLNKDQI